MKNINKIFSKIFIYFIYSLLCSKIVNAQNAEDPAKLKIEKRTLYQPSLEELKTVFIEALSKDFAKVSVEIVDSPDLHQPPFTLAASGIGGKPAILDVGGRYTQHRNFMNDKLYDIKTLASHLGYRNKPFVIGAAAGPWPYVNKVCDVTANIVLNQPNSTTSSYIATLDKIRGLIDFKPLPLNETRFSILGNLLMSEGKPGKVIKVYVQKRIGKDEFITSMRMGLEKRYSDKLVGLGGTFLVKNGSIIHHFPNFFQKPVKVPNSKLKIIKNFYLYDGTAPIVAVGTFVSNNKTGLDLESQHFHTFSHHGEGGHYRYDSTPESVEYLGYFTPGEVLYRVDQPPR